MKTYQVWSEGFKVTGEYSTATFHGSFEASSFKGAIQAFKDSLTDPYAISCVDVDGMSFWGCRFFDNESDARKSFG